MKVWDVVTGRGVTAFGYPAAKAGDPAPAVQAVLLLRDGRLVAAADKTARLWTVEGAWADARTFGPHVFRVLAIDFSPDGKLMATGGGEPSRSGEVKIWEVASGKLMRSLDNLHSDTVFALRFSPDGTKLASASADRYLKVVSVADGKELKSFEGHTHHVLAVDWSGDGRRLVTGGADSVVKVWDFEAGEQLRTLNQAAKGVTGLRWVPGKPLLFGAAGDSQVRAWNPDNGSVARTLSGAADYLFAVAASADGGRVAAGGADGVLLLWNGADGLAPPQDSGPEVTATAVAARRRAPHRALAALARGGLTRPAIGSRNCRARRRKIVFGVKAEGSRSGVSSFQFSGVETDAAGTARIT